MDIQKIREIWAGFEYAFYDQFAPAIGFEWLYTFDFRNGLKTASSIVLGRVDGKLFYMELKDYSASRKYVLACGFIEPKVGW